MKKAAFIILLSMLTSVATILVHENFIAKDQQTVSYNYAIKEPMAIQTNLNKQARNAARANSKNATEFTDAARNTAPAVVHIRALYSNNSGMFYDFWGNGSNEVSSGSGVIISSNGLIATNNHVVEDGDELEVTFFDKKKLKAKVIGTDPSTDIALLKVEGVDLPHLKLADSDKVQVGEWVLAVGNPFNLTSTVTAGIVSAKGRNIDVLSGEYSIESFIQTDAAVNPGNSGGALVNTDGELIGINTAILTRSGRYEGYSFAVPSNIVEKVVKDLSEFGMVQRGFLGVNIGDVTQEIADRYNLNNLNGVLITRVNLGSAAFEAGLKKGDVIVDINGNEVNSTPQLQEQVAKFRPGEAIDITYIRNGRKNTGKIVLKNKNNSTNLINKNQSLLLRSLGFDLRDLTPNEKTETNGNGVFVLSINRGSRIDATNMEPGFIIKKLNDKNVSSVESIIKILESTKGKVVLEGVYMDYPGEYYYAFGI